jgi:hypothetical protein
MKRLPAQLEPLKELYPNSEVIQADELFRKPRSRSVTPIMLAEGQAMFQLCRKGGDTMEDEQQHRIVIYDKKYAMDKLLSDHAHLLKVMTELDWMTLMLQVYETFSGTPSE